MPDTAPEIFISGGTKLTMGWVDFFKSFPSDSLIERSASALIIKPDLKMFKSRHKFLEIESKRGTIKAPDFCAKEQKEKSMYPIKGNSF